MLGQQVLDIGRGLRQLQVGAVEFVVPRGGAGIRRQRRLSRIPSAGRLDLAECQRGETGSPKQAPTRSAGISWAYR